MVIAINSNPCISSFFSHDADDEFVSESFQGATKKEMAEVNESMRRLGLGGGGGMSSALNNNYSYPIQ